MVMCSRYMVIKNLVTNSVEEGDLINKTAVSAKEESHNVTSVKKENSFTEDYVEEENLIR